MNSKFALALIALVGVGVFALPSTMALFAGQHSFYNIDATGNQVPCVKCHGDVKSELLSNANTGVPDAPNTEGPHANFKCEYCHRAEAGAASGDNAYGLISYGSGATARSLAIPVYFYEMKYYPESITGADTLDTIRAAGYNYANGKGGAALSPVTAAGVITPASENLYPTFNRTTNLPIDTNPVTQNTGLNLTKVTGWLPPVGRTPTLPDLVGAGSKAVNPGTAYHAASLVSCMECHGGNEPYGHYTRLTANGSNECKNCHYGYPVGNRWVDLGAGGFGLTNDVNDTGVAEAHDEFTKNPNVGGILRYKYNTSNAACVACHTHVAVDINFTKKYKIKLDAVGTGTGSWDMGGYGAEGSVKIAIYGNGTGQSFATSDRKYSDWTPQDPIYLVNPDGTKGAQVLGLNNDTSDSSTALTTNP